MQTVHVKMADEKYNYTTSVNSKLTESEIRAYFVGATFNVGTVEDQLVKCIDVAIVGETK
jgi:hypothetical protein